MRRNRSLEHDKELEQIDENGQNASNLLRATPTNQQTQQQNPALMTETRNSEHVQTITDKLMYGVATRDGQPV